MNLAARLLGPHLSAETYGPTSASEPGSTSILAGILGGRTHTGQDVSLDLAMKLDTVVACVKLYSETVGGFPIKVYETIDQHTREERPDHPAYRLLHARPNSVMPPVTFWGLAATHLVTWGESILGKRFNRRGQVEELWAIDPSRVRIEMRNRQKLYWIRDSQGTERDPPYTSNEIIHVLGFTQNGLRGISPITLARESIGAGLAIDEYTNRFFANGAVPLGVLETDQELTNDGHSRLRRDWERRHKGRRNSSRVAILEQGLKYHAISMPLKDLEFVSLQQLSAQKIARIFGVPASMIDAEGGEGKSSSYRNVETDNMRWLGRLGPSLKRIAQTLAMDEDLFEPGSSFFPEHVVDDLLRMDPKTEAEVFQMAVAGRPWMQPNEVRRIKNRAPIPALDELPPDPAAAAPKPAAKS